MMETQKTFVNAGAPWTKKEDDQLKKLYNVNMLDVLEISKIHDRSPGGIISRLCKHNYIPNHASARGYMDYKNSDLYKKIVYFSERNRMEKKIVKPSLSPSILEMIAEKKKLALEKRRLYEQRKLNHLQCQLAGFIKNDHRELQSDVKNIKNEIVKLRSTTTELLVMLNTVYDFIGA